MSPAELIISPPGLKRCAVVYLHRLFQDFQESVFAQNCCSNINFSLQFVYLGFSLIIWHASFGVCTEVCKVASQWESSGFEPSWAICSLCISMWELKGVLQRFRAALVLLDVFWQVHPVPVLHIRKETRFKFLFIIALWEICFTATIPIITRNTTETNYRKWKNFYQVSKKSKRARVETEIQAKSCFLLSILITLRRNETWRVSVLQTAEGKNSNCPAVGGSDQLWLSVLTNPSVLTAYLLKAFIVYLGWDFSILPTQPNTICWFSPGSKDSKTWNRVLVTCTRFKLWTK